jgi:hypothetical protein
MISLLIRRHISIHLVLIRIGHFEIHRSNRPFHDQIEYEFGLFKAMTECDPSGFDLISQFGILIKSDSCHIHNLFESTSVRDE